MSESIRSTCSECKQDVINVVDGIPGDCRRCLVCRFLDDARHIYGDQVADELAIEISAVVNDPELLPDTVIVNS